MVKSSVSAAATTSTGSASAPQGLSRKKATIWYVVGAVVVLFLVWPKSQSNQQAIAPVHQDTACLGGDGHRKELHYESSSGTEFDESFQDGCGTLIATPKWWGYHWQIQPTDGNNARWHIYVKEPGGKYRGPFLVASDADMHLESLVFYIQPPEGEKGVRLHFWTDLVLPKSTPPAPTPKETADGSGN